MARTAKSKKDEMEETTEKSEMQDLDALQGFVTVEVGGEDIEIRPFKFKHLLKVVKYLSDLATDLPEIQDDLGIVTLIASNSDVIFNILKLAIEKDDAFFDELDADKGVELALAVWNINKDFFMVKIRPQLTFLQIPDQLDESPNEETN